MPRRRGFTLIEVMLAVMILAAVGTASLKLVIMAQKTLAETSEREGLLNEAEAVEAGVVVGELGESGTSGDITWTTAAKETEMFGGDFGKLRFGASADQAPDAGRLSWRELTIRDKKGRDLTLYIAAKEEENAGN